MVYFSDEKTTEAMRRFKTEDFLFWFQQVYGAEETRALEELAKSKHKTPYDCVKDEVTDKFFVAEHNAGGWIPAKEEERKNWRLDD